MKIVQFMASPKYVGAERSFVELCNALAQEDEVVALVVRGCEYKERFDKKVKVIELRSNPSRYNPWLYFEIARILRQERPDIVHSHSAKATQILYRLWKVMGFAFVATKRNSERRSRGARVFDKVPFCVGVSEEVSASIHNPNKATIYNGIEPKPIEGVEKEPVFTMITIGILQPRKGFLELIEGVAQLGFDFRLWIVGEGEQRPILQEVIERHGLGDRVSLLGYREDTHLLQARSHLQIINSKREGLSRVLIEGLFYSDVVISTRVAGSVELLSEEFLFEDPKSKIEEVYRNYDRFKRAFSKIKDQKERFTLLRVAQEYRALYERLRSV